MERRWKNGSFLLSIVITIFEFQTPLNHMPELTLDGPKEKGSLFGFAMAVAGDLNKDGFPGILNTPNDCDKV